MLCECWLTDNYRQRLWAAIAPRLLHDHPAMASSGSDGWRCGERLHRLNGKARSPVHLRQAYNLARCPAHIAPTDALANGKLFVVLGAVCTTGRPRPSRGIPMRH